MQFLKTLFWCLLAFVAALFTYGNWAPVPIHLWAGLIADVNLPMLLLFVFLLGFLPTLFYQHAVRWRLRQRLQATEHALVELTAERTAPATAAEAPPIISPHDVPPEPA